MTELDTFRERYERHVGHILAGDMQAAMAEIDPEVIPAVFAEVEVPRTAVDSAHILDVKSDKDLMIGAAVYHLEGRAIGLRSYWRRRQGTWMAFQLENFPAAEVTSHE